MQRYEHGGDIYRGESFTLDFSVNINALGMPGQVRQTMADSVSRFSLYPDTQCRELGRLLSAHLQIPQEQILFGNGASDLIFRICACLRPKVVLTLAPTFSEYERPARLFGAEMREHRLREENGFLLTEAFIHNITSDVDMIFLCNPNNPTGRLAPEPLLARILEKCKDTGTYLVMDECFLDFTEGASMMRHLPDYPTLLVLKAFTKLYSLAGLRLGYLLGDAVLLEKIAQYGAEWAVSVPAQLAGVAALLEEPVWSEKTRGVTQAERIRMTRALSDLGLTVYPGDANFLLVKGKQPVVNALRERGILVRSCSNFTGLSNLYFRIAIKTKTENDILLSTLKEVNHG